jgi:hypothetical protein
MMGFALLNPSYVLLLSLSVDFVPIDLETSGFQLAPKGQLPTSGSIERFVNNSAKVGGNFEVAALKSTHAISTEPADEIAELQ